MTLGVGMAFDLHDLWLYLCLVHNLLEGAWEVVEVADAQGAHLVVAIGVLQDSPGAHVVVSRMVQVQTIEVVYLQTVEPFVDSSKGVSVVAGLKLARKPNLLARNTAVDDSLSHASLVVVAMGRVQVVIPTDSAVTTDCLTVSFRRSRPDSLESDSSACTRVPSPSCGSYTWFERSSRGTPAVETISVACAPLSDTTGTLSSTVLNEQAPRVLVTPSPMTPITVPRRSCLRVIDSSWSSPVGTSHSGVRSDVSAHALAKPAFPLLSISIGAIGKEIHC